MLHILALKAIAISFLVPFAFAFKIKKGEINIKITIHKAIQKRSYAKNKAERLTITFDIAKFESL